jgi:hypothetical protein
MTTLNKHSALETNLTHKFHDNHHWAALCYSTQKLNDIWMPYKLQHVKLIPERLPTMEESNTSKLSGTYNMMDKNEN